MIPELPPEQRVERAPSQPITSAVGEPSALAVLRNRPFLLLWLSQAATQIGGNMVIFGLTFIIFSSTNSSAAVSGLLLTFLVPSVLFSAVAGVYVDRLDRRRILVVTAEFSVQGQQQMQGKFREGMIEIALLTLMVVALVLSLRILRSGAGLPGPLVEDLERQRIALLLVSLGRHAADLRQHRQLAVAMNELHRHVEVEQTLERFPGHRTRHHVAPNHDLIDARLVNLLKHRLQRRSVGMNVIQRGDPHRDTIPPIPCGLQAHARAHRRR